MQTSTIHNSLKMSSWPQPTRPDVPLAGISVGIPGKAKDLYPQIIQEILRLGLRMTFFNVILVEAQDLAPQIIQEILRLRLRMTCFDGSLSKTKDLAVALRATYGRMTCFNVILSKAKDLAVGSE